MPSIEILCEKPKGSFNKESCPFAIDIDKNCISHRGSFSLFQKDFDSIKGILLHLRSSQTDITAYDLINIGDDDYFNFKQAYKKSIFSLLEDLLNLSSTGKIIFTSDYQFGPSEPSYEEISGLGEFYKLHESEKLRLNSLYKIHDGR